MRTHINGKYVLICSLAIAVLAFAFSLVGGKAGLLIPPVVFLTLIAGVYMNRESSSPPAWPVSRTALGVIGGALLLAGFCFSIVAIA